MYTALAMEREMRARGMAATFRATGQTGILITGDGVPLDAVVADFMAGAIEWLTPDNDADHWDLIEGQGSLFHPSYSGVTLALVHGGQPDALMLCHEPTRAHMRGLPGYCAADARGAARPVAGDGADREPGRRGGRGVDQHRRAAGRRTRSTTSPRSRRGWGCRRSIRSGRAPAAWWTRCREASRSRRRCSRWRGPSPSAAASRTEARVLTVTIEDGGVRGRGECVPYPRYGETLGQRGGADRGAAGAFDRAALQGLLPPGAARNAVDCALWDLEAKQAGRRVWELAGLAEPGPEITAYTLSLDTPEAMRAQAAENAGAAAPEGQARRRRATSARLEAVRAGAPPPRIVVDANEGWTAEAYAALAPALVALGVEMVEQPLPAGADDALAEHGAAAAGLRRRELPRPGEPAGARRASTTW